MSAARLAAALAVWTAAAPPAPAQGPPPPVLTETLQADSLYFLGRSEEAWPYTIARTTGDDQVWVVVEDPYGGRVAITDFFAIVLGRQVQAVVEGGEFGSVSITSRWEGVAVRVLGLVGLLALFAFPVVWFRRRYVRERDERRALQETARRLAASREDERLRIARDLHDGPLQDLHALHMQLDASAARLAEATGERSEEARRLRGAQDEAHTVIGELRAIAEALRPPALGPFGLAAALRAHADRFRRQHPGVAVTLDLDDDGQALPLPTRLALFRIAQEAMTNAAKHADPSQIAVALRVGGGAAELTVEDDGPGFDARALDALAADGHFGLLGMQERAGAAGACLDVEAGDPGGTRVRVAVRPAPTAPALRWASLRRRRTPTPER